MISATPCQTRSETHSGKQFTVGFDLPQCFLRAKDERLEAGLVSLKDFKPSGLQVFRCIIP